MRVFLLTFGNVDWYTPGVSSLSPQGGGWIANKEVVSTMSHWDGEPELRSDLANHLVRCKAMGPLRYRATGVLGRWFNVEQQYIGESRV